MTDQEAIKKIKVRHCQGDKYCTDCCMHGGNICPYDMAIDALEAQISLKECIANLDNPEFAHLTWSHAEVLELLKEHVADYTKGVERGESKGISAAGQ